MWLLNQQREDCGYVGPCAFTGESSQLKWQEACRRINQQLGIRRSIGQYLDPTFPHLAVFDCLNEWGPFVSADFWSTYWYLRRKTVRLQQTGHECTLATVCFIVCQVPWPWQAVGLKNRDVQRMSPVAIDPIGLLGMLPKDMIKNVDWTVQWPKAACRMHVQDCVGVLARGSRWFGGISSIRAGTHEIGCVKFVDSCHLEQDTMYLARQLGACCFGSCGVQCPQFLRRGLTQDAVQEVVPSWRYPSCCLRGSIQDFHEHLDRLTHEDGESDGHLLARWIGDAGSLRVGLHNFVDQLR
mmetsp:Transcript_12665/g.34945  ORF Transcript_12665/g.34945 Transcript_12665/m.34945 type:complete len:297 (+) Transcript_12665:299-1189(+)